MLLESLLRRESVFENIMEQAGGDSNGIQLYLCQNIGHLERMRKIGFSIHTQLAFVELGGHNISALDHFQVGFRMVAGDLIRQILIPNHLLNRPSDQRL